mmetsp:Transcript_12939/g.14851  ORF Transcript_12939/g.14851 Transcript_12939/m.14851 type:complete len:427 (-) Transcript_12939:16-1296(-)
MTAGRGAGSDDGMREHAEHLGRFELLRSIDEALSTSSSEVQKKVRDHLHAAALPPPAQYPSPCPPPSASTATLHHGSAAAAVIREYDPETHILRLRRQSLHDQWGLRIDKREPEGWLCVHALSGFDRVTIVAEEGEKESEPSGAGGGSRSPPLPSLQEEREGGDRIVIQTVNQQEATIASLSEILKRELACELKLRRQRSGGATSSTDGNDAAVPLLAKQRPIRAALADSGYLVVSRGGGALDSLPRGTKRIISEEGEIPILGLPAFISHEPSSAVTHAVWSPYHRLQMKGLTKPHHWMSLPPMVVMDFAAIAEDRALLPSGVASRQNRLESLCLRHNIPSETWKHVMDDVARQKITCRKSSTDVVTETWLRCARRMVRPVAIACANLEKSSIRGSNLLMPMFRRAEIFFSLETLKLTPNIRKPRR